MPGLRDCLWVGLGGALGTGLRFVCAMAWPLTDVVSLPLATLAVNVAGSVLIGVFAALSMRQHIEFGASIMMFLMVGFCGGLTTFSFVGLESAQLVHQGQWQMLAIYLFLSLLGWLGGVAAGYRITLALMPNRPAS
ncbi:MAG: CrcB family protein [Wenzhouxiangella sp.]|nr:CrcB family protein [Wenzhouxiangella sp.]